jgi:hypothetical protein
MTVVGRGRAGKTPEFTDNDQPVLRGREQSIVDANISSSRR